MCLDIWLAWQCRRSMITITATDTILLFIIKLNQWLWMVGGGKLALVLCFYVCFVSMKIERKRKEKLENVREMTRRFIQLEHIRMETEMYKLSHANIGWVQDTYRSWWENGHSANRWPTESASSVHHLIVQSSLHGYHLLLLLLVIHFSK